MPTMLRDALRALRAARGTTLVAFLILTLAIAASTITFSVVDTVVLRRLPFEDDRRLVAIARVTSRDPAPTVVAPQDYFMWLESQRVFENLAAWGPWTILLQTEGGIERLKAMRATASLFAVLRAAPLHGQSFGSQHEQEGQDSVALIGHGLWKRRFGGDPTVVGQVVTFGKETRRILGVMPPGFDYPVGSERPTEVFIPWVPRANERDFSSGGRSMYLHVVGRLKDGATLAQARADVEQIAASFPVQRQRVAWRDGRVHVTSLHEFVVGRAGGWMLLILGAVGLVLLVACANVANLLLARATVRARELAVRAALGASHAALARSVLLEGFLLSAASAAAGVLIAVWGLDVIKASLPAGIARASVIALDMRVLIVAIGAALTTGLAFGIVPAWQASRADVVTVLKAGAPAVGSGARALWRNAFLVVEVAFAVMLLVGTGLFVTSLIRVVTADLGFDRRDLVTFSISKSFGVLSDEERSRQQVAFATEVVDRVRQVPGVAAAAVISGGTPLFGQSTRYSVVVPGSGEFKGKDMVEMRAVTADYFRTAGLQLVEGRFFNDGDRAGAPRVAVLNDVAARRFFPDRSPLGQIVSIHGENTVVGVVKAVRLGGPEIDLRTELYLPFWQQADSNWNLMVRTTGAARPIVQPIQAALQPAVAAGQRAPDGRLFEDQFWRLTAERRFNAWMMSAFGVLALAIGAVGVYGVTAFVVAQRTRDIGVRVALGATRRRIVRSVLTEAARHLLMGAILGVAGAAAGSQLVTAILFGVSPSEVGVYAAVVSVLMAVGLLGALVPALRASRVDPIVALRSE